MKRIQIPQLPENYLDRERISSLLEQSVGVCFLSGREGCGKTSALAQFCRGKEQEVFWYTFRKEDNGKTYFNSHFLIGFPMIEDNLQKQSAVSMPELWRRLLENRKVSYIVLDNLQVLKNREILHGLCMFLEENAGRHKIFLAMSDGPAPCFSKYMALGRYRIVADQELCFTYDELLKLVRLYFQDEQNTKASGCGGEKQYAKKLVQLTGGWPVAVSCLLRFLRESGAGIGACMDMQPLDVLLDTMLYDYIDYEIYGRFSGKEKQLLMQTAVFRRLDAGLLNSCCGQGVFGGFLRRLRGKSLLCPQKGGNRDGAQYEPLFKLFVLEQMTEAQRIKQKRQAGRYYLAAGDFEEAFYYIKDDAAEIRNLLRRCGRQMMQDGFLKLFGQCLFILENTPDGWAAEELEAAAEYYYRLGNRERMEACLNEADSMFGKENQYGFYRSLYRGLFHYEEDPEKYKKQIHNAIFFLEEKKLPFPFLSDSDMRLLNKIRQEKESGRRPGSRKKIKVSAFGTFRAIIIASGKELPWRTKKGCELFAYLLDLNGEAVERKTLLAQLWREEMPNNAVAMLHNMIYNIRKELSFYNLEHMIQYKNRKYVMDTALIQSDVQQILKAAEYVEKKNTGLLLQEKSLFDSWWGVYLEDMDNVWIREKQEYYEKIFEKGCLLIAEDCMKQEDYEQAVLYLKNALSVSCYSEKIMGLLLLCYGRTGELNSAKKQYEEFVSLLKKELDIEPGAELAEIYQKCMGRSQRFGQAGTGFVRPQEGNRKIVS